jgi:hypothetical protein
MEEENPLPGQQKFLQFIFVHTFFLALKTTQ